MPLHGSPNPLDCVGWNESCIIWLFGIKKTFSRLGAGGVVGVGRLELSRIDHWLALIEGVNVGECRLWWGLCWMT